MLKSESCIFYTSLKNRFVKLNEQFTGAVGVATSISNTLYLRIVYSKLHTKFGASTYCNSRDLSGHTDIRTGEQPRRQLNDSVIFINSSFCCSLTRYFRMSNKISFNIVSPRNLPKYSECTLYSNLSIYNNHTHLLI